MTEPFKHIPAWTGYPNLVAGFTTRAFGSLSTRSDSPETIEQRFHTLAQQLSIRPDHLLTLPQTHSSNVAIIRDRNFLDNRDGRRAFRSTDADVSPGDALIDPAACDPAWQRGVDGIILAVPNVFAVVLTADCAPVMFWDPVSRICGIAHVGLVGAINQLPVRMVTVLQGVGVSARHLEVAILPSIRACHYNLARSGTWQRMKDAVSDLYGAKNPFYASGYFDLRGFIRWQLESAGVQAAQISDLGICTVCQAQDFFSHVQAGVTGSQEKEGRFGSIVGIRDVDPTTAQRPPA